MVGIEQMGAIFLIADYEILTKKVDAFLQGHFTKVMTDLMTHFMCASFPM